MKVIEPGNPQKGWAKEYVCTGRGNQGGGCKAKLLVEEADIFRTSSSHYDGSTEHYVTFECCDCNVWTDIEGVPTQIVKDAPHRAPSSRRKKPESDK
jgi:hypothetical protein